MHKLWDGLMEHPQLLVVGLLSVTVRAYCHQIVTFIASPSKQWCYVIHLVCVIQQVTAQSTNPPLFSGDLLFQHRSDPSFLLHRLDVGWHQSPGNFVTYRVTHWCNHKASREPAHLLLLRREILESIFFIMRIWLATLASASRWFSLMLIAMLSSRYLRNSSVGSLRTFQGRMVPISAYRRFVKFVPGIVSLGHGSISPF